MKKCHKLLEEEICARLSAVGPVAQGSEQIAHNDLVLGSIPSRPTISGVLLHPSAVYTLFAGSSAELTHLLTVDFLRDAVFLFSRPFLKAVSMTE